MKRFINLLPPDEQRQIANIATNAQVLRFGLWLMVSFAVLIAALLAARFVLLRQMSSVAADLAAVTETLRTLETSQLRQDLERFNLDLRNFSALSKAQQQWSGVLEDFQKLLPADLTVDSFSLGTGEKIEVAGRGGTRKSVLQLRQNILQSSSFVNVNFPLKNLERAVDAPWSYRFYVKQ